MKKNVGSDKKFFTATSRLELHNLRFSAIIEFKSIYTAFWVMDYFPNAVVNYHIGGNFSAYKISLIQGQRTPSEDGI